MARPKRSAHIFQTLKEVPWRGIMIYIKMDAKYVGDLDAELDVVGWPAKPAAVEPIAHVPPEPSVDACATAKAALLTYNYSDLNTRVGEWHVAPLLWKMTPIIQ